MTYSLAGKLVKDSFGESGVLGTCKIHLGFLVDGASLSCSEWITFKVSAPSSCCSLCLPDLAVVLDSLKSDHLRLQKLCEVTAAAQTLLLLLFSFSEGLL